MSTTTPADPRLQPENITAALDAIGDALETLIAKGQTQPFHDAYGRFREAWPRPAEPEQAPEIGEPDPEPINATVMPNGATVQQSPPPPAPDVPPPAGGGEPDQGAPAPTG